MSEVEEMDGLCYHNLVMTSNCENVNLGRRLAQSVERTPHMPRLCSGPKGGKKC